MSTALDLVTTSLQLLGVVASGEPVSAGEANDGMKALNRMLDSWTNESLMIPSKVREVFALVASQQTYTWGAGGNWNSARPQRIEQALCQIVGTTPLLELPCDILNQAQYANVRIKATPSVFPTAIYNDDANPLANINVWPVPTAVNNMVFYSWKPLADLATLTTALSLPPGFEDAIMYNLAIRLAPMFGKPISMEVAGIAAESKANVKRMNTKKRYLGVDPALTTRSSRWNWRTGDAS